MAETSSCAGLTINHKTFTTLNSNKPVLRYGALINFQLIKN